MSENIFKGQKQNGVNFNSVLIALVNILLLIVAFFFKRSLDGIESSQARLWQSIIPRTEMEGKLIDMKDRQLKTETDLEGLRTRITALEINTARQRP